MTTFSEELEFMFMARQLGPTHTQRRRMGAQKFSAREEKRFFFPTFVPFNVEIRDNSFEIHYEERIVV